MNDQKIATLSLSPDQRKSVRHLAGDVLVSAGAGTGKTRVLVERILHILKAGKASVTELLVLTFTEKAANEIKLRLSDGLRCLGLERLRRDLEQAAIGTFHGFAARLLKEHPLEAGVAPDFRVLETERADALRDEVLTAVLERSFHDADPVFEILKIYGENAVRTGLLKVLTASRHEGKMLEDFFNESRRNRRRILEQIEGELLQKARALTLKFSDEFDNAGWERFTGNHAWDWETLEDFRCWKGRYSSKRKEGWKEWRSLANDLSALKIEPLSGPWIEKFEAMALSFESGYEAAKRKDGYLDFDDLQIRAVGLFSGGRPELLKMKERYQRKFKFIMVDEFQDTNYLQMKFIDLLSSEKNVFTVGDYKQSIYGFRGAEPGIFLEREKRFSRDENAGLVIRLSQNFRSQGALLDTLNSIFKEIWSEDVFPFDPLTPKPGEDTGASDGNAVEILATRLGEEEEKDHARIREASILAARIRDLHDRSGVSYGDMAILFRRMTLSGIYEHALKSFEIPYFIMAGRGFYRQPEIRDTVSFLTHIEKPLLDIPLAAVLRSPFFHVTDSTLFWLSRHAKVPDEKTPLVRSLREIDKIPNLDSEQRKELNGFLSLTRELRALKDRISLSELIDLAFERTGYELAVLADPAGARRFANLKKLVAMIREMEMRERVPLSKFLAMIERLEVQEVRESEAQVTAERGGDAVRLMTIHAAKGLEFPVVAVADMGSESGRADSKAVLAHAREGFALRLVNRLTRKDEKSYVYGVLDRSVTKRENDESKRLFYVACTRAKKKLILSGVHEVRKKPKETYREMLTWMDWAVRFGEKLSIPILSGADHPGPGRRSSQRAPEFRARMETILKQWKAKEPLPDGNAGMPETPLPRSVDLPVSAYVLFSKDPEAFWRTYQIGWNTSGEDFRDAGSSGEDAPGYSAADFGTAMHAFFERFDIRDPDQYLEQDVLERILRGFDQKAVIEARGLIKKFLATPLFRRIQRARRVERETDFIFNARRGLIHGKLDMLFQDESGDWHLLDYKTAAGDEPSARASGYDLQLEIYSLAVSRVLGLPIRSSILYYLRNQNEVVFRVPVKFRETYFDKIEERVFELQRKILDYSNKRMIESRAVIA